MLAQISVFAVDGKPSGENVVTPAVFSAPIRPDLVNKVHTAMAKNKRQPYAVSRLAGHQTSAASWGTGRAVARIPRVSGGGTHRAGQGAFGNMCRKGRMFAPTRIWRKWHVAINLNEKRYAVASAVAASGVASLLLARGHRVLEIQEVPLVVDSQIEKINRTKDAIAFLKATNAYSDVEKVAATRKLRAGKGKMRNRRYRQRRGPLVVYANDDGISRAFRNLPGVELAKVSALNLLQLAPGGHMGRFCIWTRSAIEMLDRIYNIDGDEGSMEVDSADSVAKKDYKLPANIVSNTDIGRIMSSAEVQAVLKPRGPKRTAFKRPLKQNPLKNKKAMLKLNPYAAVMGRGVSSEKQPKKQKATSNDFLRLLHSE